jgi:hypothetical protein
VCADVVQLRSLRQMLMKGRVKGACDTGIRAGPCNVSWIPNYTNTLISYDTRASERQSDSKKASDSIS